ncbi:MAG TPA: aminotransferase class III-fold pyridoxal phosphate-dependent enzyme, partial [Euryarchaeota archaeon]|nr:aminotransferase class III-fold pyridoxal phosphate-dependent enzyme [Euryarchaeota archaeon]
VVVPPEGYLKKVRDICTKNNVLLIADEIQTGLCRTGKMFCYQHEGIHPDVLLLAKALGGGCAPISIVLGSKKTMSVFTPGSHGSTFGGNPLACAIATASLDVLVEEGLADRAVEMGGHFMQGLKDMNIPFVKEVRGKGLLIAIQLDESAGPARKYTEALMRNGLLAKETHVHTIRFAPPLTITKEQIDEALGIIRKVFTGQL